MRKFITFIGLVLAAGLCAGITYFTKEAPSGTRMLNYAFLGCMVFLILLSWMMGVRKINGIARGLKRTANTLESKQGQRADLTKLQFDQNYLDDRYQAFQKYRLEHGSGDVREFFNEYDIDTYVSKKFLDMIPDILTSAGILGTFIGLVVGLKDFDPSGYQQMSASMEPLINGIKVAFLTSIYGISLSLAFSFLLSNASENLAAALDGFLEKYYFLEKNDSAYDKLLAGQTTQTIALREMTETFSTKLADRFEEIITPTFVNMEKELAAMPDRYKEMMESATQVFIDQFRGSFMSGMDSYQKNLRKTEELQQRYMECLNASVDSLRESVGDGQSVLRTAMLETRQTLEQSAEVFEETIKKEKEAGEDLYASVVDIGHVVDSYKKVLQSNAEKESKAADGIVDAVREAGDLLESAGNSLVAGGINLSRQVETAGQSMNAAAGEMKQSVEQIAGLSQGIQTSTEEMIELSKDFRISAQEIAALSGEFGRSTEEIAAISQKIAEALTKVPTRSSGAGGAASGKNGAEASQGHLQSSHDPDAEAMEAQTALLSQLLDQMILLVEMEENRQRKGLFQRVFRKKKK
ncbi:MAG: MotA/TolQ/ExbB proton channel family protein [Lachnospiraceae bacterium]|nr:MotA/TolQ/ExbB proton channel family protein [Lachnospiraceae bacterium]